MSYTDHIKLVEGIYSPMNSADVLLSLIADKIKFHKLQILNAEEDDNDKVIHAKMRIKALEESRNLVTKLILKARDEGLYLKIDGIVNIEMVEQL